MTTYTTATVPDALRPTWTARALARIAYDEAREAAMTSGADAATVGRDPSVRAAKTALDEARVAYAAAHAAL